MKISKEELLKNASASGFRPEMLEKVWLLMDVLNGINAHPYLSGKLVLKGGTALNLFLFELPRLSIDIDLNYIGCLSKEQMLKERPIIEDALKKTCYAKGLIFTNSPQYHAGGKFQLKYDSVLGHKGNLEVDLNYLYRVPLLEPNKKHSVKVGNKVTEPILVLSKEELAAGKLTALFSRRASRDLFDTHYFFKNIECNRQSLKVAFLAYGVMSGIDLRELSVKTVEFEPNEFKRKLIPVLDSKIIQNNHQTEKWANKITEECQENLTELIRYTKEEKNFLKFFYEKGIADLNLITDDKKLVENFNNHPLLAWRMKNFSVKNEISENQQGISL